MSTRAFLTEVKRQKLRMRLGYSALDGLERGLLWISTRNIDNVKSNILNIQLENITKLRKVNN